MAYPDLPQSVKTKLAASSMRWRHRYWHLVKNAGFVNNPANTLIIQRLYDIGWSAVLTGEDGGGLDFLFMHREMIKNANSLLSSAGSIDWPNISGWPNIPTMADGPDWPEPAIQDLGDPEKWPADLRPTMQGIFNARSTSEVERNLEIAETLRDEAFLKRPDITLDRYGFLLEATVHNWMHMRFSSAPPQNTEALESSNDWLARPFSSHVNPYFWKLHGWIEDCISLWEATRDEVADLSSAWRPPEYAPPISELLSPAAPGDFSTSAFSVDPAHSIEQFLNSANQSLNLGFTTSPKNQQRAAELLS